MEREFKNTIFTKHAIERLKLRKVSQEMAVQAIRSPDDKQLEDDGDTRFTKKVNGRTVQVVARYVKEEKKWLVISAWVRGENDPQPIWIRLILLPVRIIQEVWDFSKRGRGKPRSRK